MIANRRQLLKSGLALSAVGIAGCTGNSNEQLTVRLATATEGAAGQVAGSAFASVVNNNSDDVTVQAVPTTGSEANVGLLERREQDIALVNEYNIRQAVERVGPFENISFDLTQTFHLFSTQWMFWAPEDRDISSIEDINSDTKVAISSEGAGLRPPMIRFLNHAVDDYDLISLPHPQQLGAFQEGLIDVGIGPKIANDNWTSYVQEQISVLDLVPLEFDSNSLSKIDDDPLIQYVEIDPGDGWVGNPESAIAGNLNYDWVAHPDVSNEAVYAMMKAMYENRVELEDAYSLLRYHGQQNGEFFVNVLNSVPFHQGAANFWKEVDLWRPEFNVYNSQ